MYLPRKICQPFQQCSCDSDKRDAETLRYDVGTSATLPDEFGVDHNSGNRSNNGVDKEAVDGEPTATVCLKYCYANGNDILKMTNKIFKN